MFAAWADLFTDAHTLKLSLNPLPFTNKMVNKLKEEKMVVNEKIWLRKQTWSYRP